MSDLISREAVINAIADTILNGESLGYVLAEEIVSEIPSADIMECARAIKEYCRDRDNLDEPCEGCPFHFYMGYKGHCRFKSFPSEWKLPEREKGGNDDNT